MASDIRTGFFEESPGVKSNIRLASFIILWVAIVIMIWHEVKHLKSTGDEAYSDKYCYFIIILLAFAFFPKVVQKVIETVLQVKLGNKADITNPTHIEQTTKTETKIN